MLNPTIFPMAGTPRPRPTRRSSKVLIPTLLACWSCKLGGHPSVIFLPSLQCRPRIGWPSGGGLISRIASYANVFRRWLGTSFLNVSPQDAKYWCSLMACLSVPDAKSWCWLWHHASILACLLQDPYRLAERDKFYHHANNIGNLERAKHNGFQ